MYGATPLVHEPPAKRRIMVAPLALAAVSMTIFWCSSDVLGAIADGTYRPE